MSSEAKLEQRAQARAERDWKQLEADEAALWQAEARELLAPMREAVGRCRSTALAVMNERIDAARRAYEAEASAARAECAESLKEPEHDLAEAERDVERRTAMKRKALLSTKDERVQGFKQGWLNGYHKAGRDLREGWSPRETDLS